MSLSDLTLGSDPECFFYSENTNQYVSSIGRIGGTKEMPLPIPGGAILEDNVAAEFNTTPVKYDDGPEAFVTSITSVRDQLAALAKSQNLSLKFVSQAEFHPSVLDTPQALESGCDPDYNIYSKQQNEYPPLFISNKRYCGGHVHIGHPLIISLPKILSYVISSLDASIGCAFLLKEGLNDRIHTYGKFGNFRPKPYGVEYRSVNNTWVEQEEDIRFVREMVAVAISDAMRGKSFAGRIADIQTYITAVDNISKVRAKIADRMHPQAYSFIKAKGWL